MLGLTCTLTSTQGRLAKAPARGRPAAKALRLWTRASVPHSAAAGLRPRTAVLPKPAPRSLALRCRAVAEFSPPTTAASGSLSSTDQNGNGLEDIVIVGACRTACCRAKKGAFKDTPADELVLAVMKDVMRRTGVQPDEVDDVCLGSVFPPSSKRANECRQATLLAGFPPSVPVYTVNRQCAAGLQAIANVAASIKAGYCNIGIAGGVESMTTDPLDWQGSNQPKVHEKQEAKDVLLPLGVTAENVASQFGVPREVEDALAAASHTKAAAARQSGKFRDEIVPVETVWRDPVTGEEKRLVVVEDDGIRPDTTPEKLAQLKPCFVKGGTVTPGNSCQNTDAAAAVMLMTRREALRRGLPVMATLRSFTAVGVPPAVMGTAPSVAIPRAVEKAGLNLNDIDIFEINEAFASQAAFVRHKLNLPEEKVNPLGGAIALGHPAGATGARQTVTLLHELARRGQRARYGVVSMCTGAGMGAAAVFESGSSMDSTGSSLGSLNSIDTLCKGECLGANGQANGQQAEGANGKTD